MFKGFSDETFEFFMAIKFNNNREFFTENHDWYVRAVREPMLELAQALSGVIENMDSDFDRRPNKAVSRINRDIRFSKDKSPYRDYMWIAFRNPGEERGATLGPFFDFSCENARYGMGFYDANRPVMNGFRRELVNAPEEFLEIWSGIRDEFTMHGNALKRMKIPDNIPEAAREWYNLKGFFVAKELNDFSLLKSPALADELIMGFERLTPLYKYFKGIIPEEGDTL